MTRNSARLSFLATATLCVVWTWPTPSPALTVSFVDARRDFLAGGGAATVGDFDGDGIPDLVARSTGYGDNTVSVRLGQGDGTFKAPRYFDVGDSPGSVVVGDFNRDGVEDLAVTTSTGVAVLLGNGQGAFKEPLTSTTGSGATGILPTAVAVGDFNRDGAQDLVVVGFYSSINVGILLGNGDGTFQAPLTFASGGAVPLSVAVGDFNGDGVDDLAIANNHGGPITVLLGNGDGTFWTAQSLSAGARPSFVAVGDFNRDGVKDLAIVNQGSRPGTGSVSVMLGNGDGTFRVGSSLFPLNFPRSVAMADFDGDGIQDLAVSVDSLTACSGSCLLGSGAVFLGNGDGTFRAALTFVAAGAGSGLVVGDFNGDGRQDVAVGLSVLLGNGDGSFQTVPTFPVGTRPSSVALGDFNGDGKPDLAVANAGSNDVSVLLGVGNGAFQAPLSFGAGTSPASVAVGDFNGDGKPDLAVANAGSNDISVLLGVGDGAFQAPLSFGAGTSPASVAVGDFNSDGKLDLAVANTGSNTVSVALGNGDGTFQTALSFGVGTSPASVAVGDFNRDGTLDLVVANSNTGAGPNTVSVLLGNGDGTFQAAQNFPAGDRPTFVAVGDLNGDGVQDLAVANDGFGYVSVLLGNGDGTFQAARNFTAGAGSASVALGDFNGDGVQDLAVTSNSLNDVSVLLGNGDGTFDEAKVAFGAGLRPGSVVVGDFDGDGRLDVAVANASSNDVSVLINTTPRGVGTGPAEGSSP